MTYLVMECHPGYAVVLSEEGQFLKAANLRYKVGQTVDSIVEVRPPDAQRNFSQNRSRRWIASAAAMAACLVLAISGLVWQNMPYASVYMAINPQVRIDVNRRDMVVDIESVNADGAALLTGYEYGKKDLNQVMTELTDRSIHMGYLHAGGKITVTLDADEAWSIGHSSTIRTGLEEHLGKTLRITIEVTGPFVPGPPQSTSPGESIVIPVPPPADPPKPSAPKSSGRDSDYGDSGYGDSGYDD